MAVTVYDVLIGSHFVFSMVLRSFGDAHLATFAIFLTGSLLFRFDVLFSGGFFMLASCLSTMVLLDDVAVNDDEDDDETDGRIGVVELLVGDLVVLWSLSLDKLVGSGAAVVVSLFGSVFGIFGDCTKGESVLVALVLLLLLLLGMRGVK